VKIICILAEIQTRHPLNTINKHRYLLNQLISVAWLRFFDFFLVILNLISKMEIWCSLNCLGPSNHFFYMFVFNVALSIETLTSDNKMIDDWWIEKDLEGSGCGIMRYYPGIFLEGLRKTTKRQQDSQWCGWCLNWAPPKYSPRALPLSQPVLTLLASGCTQCCMVHFKEPKINQARTVLRTAICQLRIIPLRKSSWGIYPNQQTPWSRVVLHQDLPQVPCLELRESSPSHL
jgi:hypothetical protein